MNEMISRKKVFELIDKQIVYANKFRGKSQMNDLRIEGEIQALSHLKNYLESDYFESD